MTPDDAATVPAAAAPGEGVRSAPAPAEGVRPAPAPAEGCEGCGRLEASVLFEASERRFGLPGRFSVVRCSGCGLVRTEPPPADPAAYYPAGEYYSYAPPAPVRPMARARFRAAYDRADAEPAWRRTLARLAPGRLAPGLPPGPPGEILDVGCGSGEFLLGLREAGWTCYGIEPDAAAVAAAQAAGILGVQEGDLLEAAFPSARFDAVRFWHSLEHVPAPRAQLAEARRILRPGGALIVGVPNFGSLGSRLARERWFNLDVPRHLWHFEPSTLRRLATGCGFEVRRLRLMSGSTPLLGTVDYVRGRGERLVNSRAAWYAALPAAALLDTARLGDAIELTAVAAP